MKILTELRQGHLAGETRLSLSCGLTIFPREIFDLADTLEILDLTNNQLESLPDDFGRFKKLRILFLSENNFEALPVVLAQCPALTMIGFKANKISHIPENSLPLGTQWLILTDNKIEKLPESIGKLRSLQKCMLSGNRLILLPDSMSECKNLELLRISANKLEMLPSWLFDLPKLSWLACAGNPATEILSHENTQLDMIHWDKLTLNEELGEGASGLISKGYWECASCDVAVKVFKGEVTSDGHPLDEMRACIAVGEHDNLPTVHGKFHGHPEDKEGIILSLIPPTYITLGNPPSLESCTRDVYKDGTEFTFLRLMGILLDIASVMLHLHEKKVMHGDLYAHNILVNEEGHALLSDFGAATLYGDVKSIGAHAFERLEVRAFGCLVEDLLVHHKKSEAMKYAQKIEALQHLRGVCMDEVVHHRPLFLEIHDVLCKIGR